MRRFRNFVFAIFRLCAGIAISFFLFTAVSMLHGMFTPKQEEKKAERTQVEADIYRKVPEPEKKTQQKIRPVNVPQQGGKSQSGDRMTMKFTPDLGIDAGPGGEGVALQKKELEAEVFDEGQTDEDVVVEDAPPVPYSERAKADGAEGEFEAIIVIGHTGKVTSVDIVKSPHPSITADARKLIASWRFKPAKNKGVPVSVRKRIRYDFKLN